MLQKQHLRVFSVVEVLKRGASIPLRIRPWNELLCTRYNKLILTRDN